MDVLTHASVAALGALLVAATTPAAAQTAEASARAPLLESLLACRGVAGEPERLACFDRAAAAFDTAERAGEVTVVDQQIASQTRTRLFGLNLDSANLFTGLRQTAPVNAIETALTSARQGRDGAWVFVLADGSTWRQIDQERLTARATPGSTVRIRRGAMGSFLLSVNGSRSVRARRDN